MYGTVARLQIKPGMEAQRRSLIGKNMPQTFQGTSASMTNVWTPTIDNADWANPVITQIQ